MSPLEIAIVFVAVAAGCMVQGAAGFGAAVLAAPILLLVEPDLVPAPLIIAMSMLVILMAIRERHHIDLSGLGWAIVGRLPGTAVGALAVASLSGAALDIALGGMLLCLVVLSAAGIHVEPTRGAQLVAGGLSGLSGTATSVGGPPMALLYQRRPGPVLRATLAAYFCIGIVTSLGGLWLVGELGAAEWKAGALLCIPAVIGLSLSRFLAGRLDLGHTRTAVLVISSISAASVLARGLL